MKFQRHSLFNGSDRVSEQLDKIGFLFVQWAMSHIQFSDDNRQQKWKAVALISNIVWIVSIGWVFILLGHILALVIKSETEGGTEN